MIRALVAAAAAGAAAAQAGALTLQPCAKSSSAQLFSYAGGVVTQAGGLCVGASPSSGAAVAAQPCTGGASQKWAFMADGTVASGADASLCFNAFGGATSQNTPVVLYQCGVVAVAANDVFALLATGQIFANESSLCLSSVAAPPPPPPPPAPTNGSCVDEYDCSLSGACTAGVCACYPPWTGSLNCEALAFAPTPVLRGYPHPLSPGRNETTWGGSIVRDPVGGLYHMFVAEMMNECPLSTWGQNSRCTHASASTPEGPYSFADVSVTNWCHNPHVVVQDNSDGTHTWALFHIGTGDGGATQNCSASASAAVAAADGVARPAAGATLHTAPGPDGPWTPVPGLPSCNNPAPFLAKNGTWLVVCDGFTLYSAPAVTAPWTRVASISSTNGNPLPGNYEDPLFWIDARGNFHVIYHVYRTGGASAHNCTPGNDGAVVSGHYFSRDGFTWRAAGVSPYGNVIDLADGSQQLLTTRERPKFIFNAAGEPTYLSNGVCPSPGNFDTPVSCPEVATGCECAMDARPREHARLAWIESHGAARPRLLPVSFLQSLLAGVDCKYRDWDFTNVSPLVL